MIIDGLDINQMIRSYKKEIKRKKKEISCLEEKRPLIKLLKFLNLAPITSAFGVANFAIISFLILFGGPEYVCLLVCELPFICTTIENEVSLKKADVASLKQELEVLIVDLEHLENMFLNKKGRKTKEEDKPLETISCKEVLDSSATLGCKVATIDEVDQYIDERLAHKFGESEIEVTPDLSEGEATLDEDLSRGPVRKRNRGKQGN